MLRNILNQPVSNFLRSGQSVLCMVMWIHQLKATQTKTGDTSKIALLDSTNSKWRWNTVNRNMVCDRKKAVTSFKKIIVVYVDTDNNIDTFYGIRV